MWFIYSIKMNEELSAYTFDVDKKISLNGIGSVGFKNQTTDTGILVSNWQKVKSEVSWLPKFRPEKLKDTKRNNISSSFFFRNAGITYDWNFRSYFAKTRYTSSHLPNSGNDSSVKKTLNVYLL